MEENVGFSLQEFDALPPDLPPSCYVDFLLLLGGLKPAIRLHVVDPRGHRAIALWGEEYGYALSSNLTGYICIAKTEVAAVRLRELDDSYEPHEYELGLMLGYPPCCCRKAADVGESNLDAWEEDLSQDASFQRIPNCLIAPGGYTEGSSLISHIPCSAGCESSLSIARAALRIVRSQKDSHHFSRWSRWFDMSATC